MKSIVTNPLTTLCIDSIRGNVKTYAKGREGHTDDAIRNEFLNILGIDSVDKVNYHLWNRHADEIYEVMETTLNITIPDAWAVDPFYQELVEVKNGNLDHGNQFLFKTNLI